MSLEYPWGRDTVTKVVERERGHGHVTTEAEGGWRGLLALNMGPRRAGAPEAKKEEPRSPSLQEEGGGGPFQTLTSRTVQVPSLSHPFIFS